jgi:carbamoyltransferase
LSGFDECAAMVIDGQGNYKEDLTENLEGAKLFPENCESSYIERESFYEFKDGKCKVVRKNFGMIHKSFVRICGLGHLYETVSSYIFQSRFDAGKVMGLAPYGKELLPFKMISVFKDAEIIYHNEWVKGFKSPNRYKIALEKNWREYADLAMKVQSELETGVMALTKWFRKHTSSENLCHSGGVALNCSANYRILLEGGFKNFFVAPAASDCGISIGCAYYGHFNILGKQKKANSGEYLDYTGKKYAKDRIIGVLVKYREQISFSLNENIAVFAARLIANGKVVAWFQDGSEFGPRALGNRSIVGDPRNSEMFSRMNRIKKREAFRPLAPSALEEKAREYFDIKYSPYMLLNARVKEDKKAIIPALTHVDGTARVQTVNEKQNQRYYSLINEFYKITGVPVIIDTSFNIDGPIVETPEDALECFVNSEIDYLCIEDFLVNKKGAES